MILLFHVGKKKNVISLLTLKTLEFFSSSMQIKKKISETQGSAVSQEKQQQGTMQARGKLEDRK